MACEDQRQSKDILEDIPDKLNSLTLEGLETMEVKDAYKEFNPQLVRSLPLKDAHFIAELTKQDLFYGDLKEIVAAESTQSNAAARFLYEAVERSLDIGNRDPFDKLLLVMEKFGSTLNKLVKEIKQKISAKNTPSFSDALQSDEYHIKWSSCSNLPAQLYHASVAVSGCTVYVLGMSPDETSNHLVFCYDVITKEWDKLPPTDHRHGILQIVDEKLTIFGGTDPITKQYHNKVSTYDKNANSWYKCYPDMLHNRHLPGVIIYNDYVIVMGGKSSLEANHDSIEVMNYHQQLQWKEVSFCLPVPMWCINSTLSGDNIVIIGYSHSKGHDNAFYRIPVDVIVSSTIANNAVSKKRWKQLSAALYWRAAIVPYSDPPIIIGGNGHVDQGGVRTSDVTQYNISKNSWRKVASLTSARNSVGVALISTNTLIVVGGSSSGVGIEAAKASSLTTVELGKIVPKLC